MLQIRQKNNVIVAILFCFFAMSTICLGAQVSFADPSRVTSTCDNSGNNTQNNIFTTLTHENGCGTHAYEAAIPIVAATDCTTLSKCDLISKYINPFINFLAALVGVAVVASIIIGGIQYGSSAGDPQKVSAAKNRIRNAVVALVTFIFLYALLNFLIPGGLT